jgi:hypothetical protein
LPYSSQDTFYINVTGDARYTPPELLSFQIPAAAPVGQEVPLSVEPFLARGHIYIASDGSDVAYAEQTSHGDNMDFTYNQGADPKEIDTGAYDSVGVTVLSMPARDGDPMRIRVRVHFVDGHDFDEDFEGPAITSVCP